MTRTPYVLAHFNTWLANVADIAKRRGFIDFIEAAGIDFLLELYGLGLFPIEVFEGVEPIKNMADCIEEPEAWVTPQRPVRS